MLTTQYVLVLKAQLMWDSGKFDRALFLDGN